MKFATLIITLLMGGQTFAGNGSSVHRMVISDDTYIHTIKKAIENRRYIRVNGEYLIPGKLEGAINRYKVEAKTLEGHKSTVNIRVEAPGQ